MDNADSNSENRIMYGSKIAMLKYMYNDGIFEKPKKKL
jgi:hypothetical protein